MIKALRAKNRECRCTAWLNEHRTPGKSMTFMFTQQLKFDLVRLNDVSLVSVSQPAVSSRVFISALKKEPEAAWY